jgi:large subunit ribosomal protein L6
MQQGIAMSRIAKLPVKLVKGVTAEIKDQTVTVKGAKGSLSMSLNPVVKVAQDGEVLRVSTVSGGRAASAVAGTTRALIQNMVKGVNAGFEKKLELVGVGYRAQAQGNKLNMTLGLSHPIVYQVPAGISVETPSQTEIIVKGVDRQKVGQVAATLREFRPPEPYKGKGVRYANEQIVLKEAKKK